MKKHVIAALAVVCLTLLSHGANKAYAAELVTNGGFETGNFTGWTVVNVTNNIWFNWMVTGPSNAANSTSWTNGSSPHSGSFDAWNGWAAGNPVPDAYRLRQDITIPNNANELIQVSWWEREQWDLITFTNATTSTLPQFIKVNVLNTSNVQLQEVGSFTAPAFSRGPMLLAAGQGWTQHFANLSAYKGQTIRLELECTVAQNTIGPGYCEFDDISVKNLVPTAAYVSVGGRVTTDTGMGIGGASVSLIDSQGNMQYTTTGQLGYYNFDGVMAGQTCIVDVQKKRYTFPNSPRLVNVEDNVTDADFQASP